MKPTLSRAQLIAQLFGNITGVIVFITLLIINLCIESSNSTWFILGIFGTSLCSCIYDFIQHAVKWCEAEDAKIEEWEHKIKAERELDFAAKTDRKNYAEIG